MTEQISALTDDEIAFEDAERLIASFSHNSHTSEIWGQYHLIGDVMRGAGALSPNFKTNLMQKIELEPTVLSPNAGLKNHFPTHSQSTEIKSKMPITWSIAASFSAVIVVGWMVLQTQVTTNPEAPAMVAQALPAQGKSIQIETKLVSAPATQVIPSEYLMAHQATAPSASSYYIQTASYSE